MRYLTLLACCLMAWSAQSASIDRINVISYGIASGPVGTRDGVSSSGIEHWITPNTRVVEATSRIPACFGVRFGIMFSVVGAAGGPPVNVMEVYRFPRSGLHKPDILSPIYETHISAGLSAGKRYGVWYEFDYPWELATGDWTFELREGNRLLASQTFAVVIPRKGECPSLSV